MNEFVCSQLRIWFVFFVTGIVCMVIFEFFRLFRKIVKTGNFSICIQDILYWIIIGFLIVYVLLVYTNGELRMYMLFGLISGVLFYIGGLNIVKKINKKIKKGWKKRKNMV